MKTSTELNQLDWEMAVINTKELMRSLTGEMSEQRLFYLKNSGTIFPLPQSRYGGISTKLNPLLMQFVALRSALVEISFGYQGALIEARPQPDLEPK